MESLLYLPTEPSFKHFLKCLQKIIIANEFNFDEKYFSITIVDDKKNISLNVPMH